MTEERDNKGNGSFLSFGGHLVLPKVTVGTWIKLVTLLLTIGVPSCTFFKQCRDSEPIAVPANNSDSDKLPTFDFEE